MWNTIANFRENLSQIASDVLDTAEELEIGTLSQDNEDGDSHTQSSSVKGVVDNGSQLIPRDDSRQASIGAYGRRKQIEALQKLTRPRRIHGTTPSEGDSNSNGVTSSSDYEPRLQELQKKCQDLESHEKDLSSAIQAKEHAYAALNDNYHEALDEVQKLKEALGKLQSESSALNAQLQKEHESAESALRACNNLEEDKLKILGLLSDLQKKKDDDDCQPPNEGRIHKEIETRDKTIARLQEIVSAFEKERSEFQAEREQLKETLDLQQLELQQASSKTPKVDTNDNTEMEVFKAQAQQVDVLLEKLRTFENEKAELKEKLEAVTLEKDKAVSNLSRLKQHLLDKETADSEKMDRDSEQIAKLEAMVAASNARIMQLEQALSQAVASQTDTNKRNSDELQKSKLEIESLKQKLNNCYVFLESKDVELANLQSALGQYYAESDAKERLHGELRIAKEELIKLYADLEAAKGIIGVKENEKKEALQRLEFAEKKRLDAQHKTQKLEENMLRLRHALEESMIRLNRMSSDSDFSVDRRLVIKLLVTYFEKSHSREVLDLMARILGFSEDDKRRVGLAHQNAGKPGVVRSVLGFPGRVVGGLLGSNSEAPGSFASSSNQSFADLWIDFLLKESEERDRKERAESEMNLATQGINSSEVVQSQSYPGSPASPSDAPVSPASHNTKYSSHIVVNTKGPENGYFRDDIFGADFSTVPLNSSSTGDGRGGHRRVYSRP